jgi:hypothetical protein
MKIKDILKESIAPVVGRKYQHIEDLIFTNGCRGGLHAIERLRQIATENANIELKWDGSPILYWGKDNDGRFSMMTKNAWDYLKKGKTVLENGVSTVMYSPNDVKQFILNTGTPSLERTAYANRVSNLWKYLESASPTKGYVEGGILFDDIQRPTLNVSTGEYEFTPNITKFHVSMHSNLGKRIAESKVMIAVTGYYDSIGSINESRYPDAETLSTDEVIIQGTKYIESTPKIDLRLLDLVEQMILENSELIDNFLKPSQGLSRPGDILYKFFNQNLRLSGTKEKFHEWAKTNLSLGQSQKILSRPGLNTVLSIVESLTEIKTQIIETFSNTTHGDIRQTNPEGYAQAHPNKTFKNDMPGQFIKMINQSTWAPRK